MQDLGEQRVGQRRAVDHRQILRGGDRFPARAVQARRRPGSGVDRSELCGLGVHLRHRRLGTAQHLTEQVGRVVAGHHQQRVQQLAGGVGGARHQSHTRALDVGTRRRRPNGGIGVELIEHHHRQ